MKLAKLKLMAIFGAVVVVTSSCKKEATPPAPIKPVAACDPSQGGTIQSCLTLDLLALRFAGENGGVGVCSLRPNETREGGYGDNGQKMEELIINGKLYTYTSSQIWGNGSLMDPSYRAKMDPIFRDVIKQGLCGLH